MTKLLTTYFGLEGRANRLGFFLRSLAALLVGLVVMVALYCAFWFIHPMAGIAMMSLGPLFIVGSWIALMVQRLHDLDYSGLWVLLILVPGVNVLLWLVLLVVKGTTGPNRFGVDPCQPTLVV